jgi:hypothetical protein
LEDGSGSFSRAIFKTQKKGKTMKVQKVLFAAINKELLLGKFVQRTTFAGTSRTYRTEATKKRRPYLQY